MYPHPVGVSSCPPCNKQSTTSACCLIHAAHALHPCKRCFHCIVRLQLSASTAANVLVDSYCHAVALKPMTTDLTLPISTTGAHQPDRGSLENAKSSGHARVVSAVVGHGHMTASECVSALRYALWHVTRLRGLSWADRIAVGLLKFVAIAGYHFGKWRTLGVAPPRRPDAAVSRKALEPLIHTALNGCESGGSSNHRPGGVSSASPQCRRRPRQLGSTRCQHLQPSATPRCDPAKYLWRRLSGSLPSAYRNRFSPRPRMTCRTQLRWVHHVTCCPPPFLL